MLEPFKSGVPVSHSSLVLLDVSPSGFQSQNQILWRLLCPVQGDLMWGSLAAHGYLCNISPVYFSLQFSVGSD